MNGVSSRTRRCIIIAGPNGAGKTTFAREFLPKDRIIHFVNADLIAGGLSPLRPELAALAGGRLFLAELDRLARLRTDFAFESTLSGLGYLRRLKRWKSAGYRIEIIFCDCRHRNWRCVASPLASGKAGITFRAPMFCGDSTEVGKISIATIVRLQTVGKSMIILDRAQHCSKLDHEANKTNQASRAADARWSRVAPRRARCAQNRARLRHSHLRLARWKSRGGKTVNAES